MKIQSKKQFPLVNVKQVVESEIKILTDKAFYFKINTNKTIDYANHEFSKISGYEAYELIDEPISTLFHSDMPKVILTVLQERLENGKSMQVIQKYRAKNNQFFWLSSIYSAKIDSEGVITNYTCESVPISPIITEKIKHLYSILSKIESKMKDTEAAKKYLIGYLETLNTTYNVFIKNMCDNSKTEAAQSHETKDLILKKIQEQNRVSKNKQQVSYSKRNTVTIKHDFIKDENVLKQRA